ncbi:MAG: serine/threonine protein kinase, partial [Deltaproteobacteria bacterium]|nr:serine/threonine protein kinase [Deltaproteobacteria bacterium]
LKCLKKLKDKGFTDSGLVKEIARVEKAYLATVETMAEAADSLVPVDFDNGEKKQTRAVEQDIPFELLSRYEVIKKLGEGGTAVVYLAEDKVLKRSVVLKFLRNFYLPPEIAEKYFLREAQTAAQLSHQNIVTIYDLGVLNQQLYIVMEYLDGVTLDDLLIQRKQGIEFSEAVKIVEELAKAIDFAHSKKVVHRDIKPGNIIITKSGAIKLMDFGMAKIMDAKSDRSQYICGTPDYMSPEQESGEEPTNLSDIYSFGVTILEMLCNRLPPVFGGREMLADMRESYLKTLEDKIPMEVVAVIRKTLSPLKENRPASAGEIARVFREFSRGTKREAGYRAPNEKRVSTSDFILSKADTGMQLI